MQKVITISVLISENNVNHQIDLDMDTIIYSLNGTNKVVWRSRDPEYMLEVWRYEHENEVVPDNVHKDAKIVSTAVEIADQVNRKKQQEI